MGKRFQNEELRDAVAVGAVGPDSARLWMRADRPGGYRVQWWPAEAPQDRAELTAVLPADSAADHTLSFAIPGENAPLDSLTRYRFQISSTQDDRLIGEGGFETTPARPDDTPSTFSFAIMSCNQPFDQEGALRKDARRMLHATRVALERHDCKFVLMMGDQMYSDMPAELSLFNAEHFADVAPPGRDRIQDCTVAEVRRLYQQRYRHFGGVPELRDLLSNFPCYTTIDDHDMVDNWGSDPAHHTAEWQAFGEGARWAYYDYQAAHMQPRSNELPASFHYQLTYGHTSIFVMDLRSQRWVDKDSGQLYSEDQERDLENFLKRNPDQKVLFLVLSVPPVHLPRYLAVTAAHISQTGEDFSDRWSSLAHIDDRDRFLKRIRAHQRENPEQRLVFLAGDIHVGCAHKLLRDGGEDPVYQFISSGLTNRVSKPIQIGARLLMRFNRRVHTRDGELQMDVRRIGGVQGRTKNPYAALNVGIVEITAESYTTSRAGLRYYIYGHDGDEPACVFETPLL